MNDDVVVIPDHRPIGYEAHTKCCINCKFASDHSHPDGYEVYCGYDGTEPPYPPHEFSEAHDDAMMKWVEWGVSRLVHVWAVCLKFEPKEVKVK